MIVSALLTSVGVNLGFCILLFALYSILRKQPGNAKIYSPRLLVEGRAQERTRLSVERLLPSAGWVRRAWHPTEDELLEACGLDAVVFMRIFIFSLRVFSVAGVIGIFVLLPVNYWGDHFTDIDFSDLTNKSLDLFSISNIKDGSNRLWVHFSAAYIITGVVCYLLYYEYKSISSKRVAYFIASEPEARQFTILVRGIPLHDGTTTLSETVGKFFTEYHPSTYLSHIVVHQMSKLHGLIEIPAAFVCFKSRYGAASALHIQQAINPTEWVTERAPEPHDVYWPLFSASFMQRWICKPVVYVASIFVTIIFVIPVAFVQGLTYLPQLETMLPFLKGILQISVISQLITGYLPSVILHWFQSFIPPIMKFLSTMQGYVAHSEIEKSTCSKMLWFTLWNIFFANTLTGSLASQVGVFFDPKNIPLVLAVVVPAQATFYIAYAVTSWANLSLELTCLFPLMTDWMGRHCSKGPKEFQPPSIAYYSVIPKLLLFGLIGLAYFLLAPVIMPFILIYFCIGYIIYRHQLLNVYLPKYETGGQFWPIVHNSTVFALILMQAILLGIFLLKKVPLAAGLVLPLPVLTLLFNDYCRKCFLPIFSDYSAETLIKKDRKDSNDPDMNEFYRGLVSAYRDSALMPISHTVDINEQTAPLLQSIES